MKFKSYIFLTIFFVFLVVFLKRVQSYRDKNQQLLLWQHLLGFSTEDLNSYLLQNYGVGLTDLTRTQGAEVIKAFQAGNVYKPETARSQKES